MLYLRITYFFGEGKSLDDKVLDLTYYRLSQDAYMSEEDLGEKLKFMNQELKMLFKNGK